MNTLNEIHDFIRKAGAYFLATVDGDLPKVRPISTLLIYEGRLYFQTGAIKPVYRQLRANPRVALCALNGDRWLRVEATAVEDARVEPKTAMLDAFPELRGRYSEVDGITKVFWLRDGAATLESLSGEKKTLRF
jgi:uncharacterized pyridoxamine 5'-phosphate oxidase family protein